MSAGLGLFLTVILEIAVFTGINYLAFTRTKGDIKKRLIAGVIFLLLTPVIFFGTLAIGFTYDDSGWGAGFLTVIFTGLYILNGIIVLLSAIHIHLTKLD